MIGGARALGALALLLAPALAGATEDGGGPVRHGAAPPSWSVAEAIGEGVVTVEPDQAVLTVGVRTEGQTAQEASERNAQRMTAVLQSLAAAGFSGPSVSTQGITLAPRYDHRPAERPRIIGYEASNHVRITTTEPALLGKALDGAVQAGANVVGALAFGLGDPRPSEREAIRRAVQDAQERLAAMVGALGKRITRVIEARVLEPARPIVARETFAVAAAAAPTPVEPGQISVRVRVLLRAEFQ
jgi:hypothetical protein